MRTADLTITSDLELGHVIVVALDGKPLATSERMLLQVMSEERPTNFRTQPAGNGLHRITDIGRDPWLVKELTGAVKFHRADSGSLAVDALDFNGYPVRQVGLATGFKLDRETMYYLIATARLTPSEPR